MKPKSLDRDVVFAIAADFDATAEICSQHGDRTGAAAFRTCANRIRRAVGLRELDPWASPQAAQEPK